MREQTSFAAAECGSSKNGLRSITGKTEVSCAMRCQAVAVRRTKEKNKQKKKYLNKKLLVHVGAWHDIKVGQQHTHMVR